MCRPATASHTDTIVSFSRHPDRNPSTAPLISLSRLLTALVPLATWSIPRMDEGESSATNLTDVVVPEIAILGASIAATLVRLYKGLVVHADPMAANLELTRGQILSKAHHDEPVRPDGPASCPRNPLRDGAEGQAHGGPLPEVMAEADPQAGHLAAEARASIYLGAITSLIDAMAPKGAGSPILLEAS